MLAPRLWASGLRIAALLTLLVAVSDPSRAAAQETSDDEARGLFAAGEAAYRAGHFEDALQYFVRAHELSHRDALLYNVGLAAAASGDERQAVDAFERYLASVPDAPNREQVEGRLAGLRRQVEEEEAARRAIAEAEARAAQEAASHAEARARAERAQRSSGEAGRAAGWGLTISGAVLVATGAVLFGVGMADVATVEGAADGTRWTDLAGAHERAPILTGVGIGGGALGLAALGVGVALLATSPGGEDGPSVAIGPGGALVRGRF